MKIYIFCIIIFKGNKHIICNLNIINLMDNSDFFIECSKMKNNIIINI